ncbi:hypothetical protein OZN62_06110 [Aurantiacibacter sp. MUD11]|uniref:hypothetical protein n=1 Tax=Aurantiacibacter sp. MUD11 TaxID=3003265 RepID=UPI0022AA2F6A|nr:hypothetical protein [Aurantiacibacter sp. MUD11]WAT19137.1 hypothetical protein OZN62_06110 [Aurantiacibacter sp. MUD11]
MSAGHSRRGWPLLSLGLLLGAWVLTRVVLWEVPFGPQATPLQLAPVTEVEGAPMAPPQRSAHAGMLTPNVPVEAQAPEWLYSPAAEPLERPDFSPEPVRDVAFGGPVARGSLRNANRLMAHAMLLSAGYQSGTKASQNAPYRPGAGPVAPGAVYAPEAARDFAADRQERRWSFDLWALWRDDTTTPLTSGRPSYGRSQVGAVVRYQLAPSSSHAPQLHLRATRALEGASETDVAAGISARPLGSIPVRLAAEARVSETDRGTELRGAAYAVSELPPVALPAGLTAEAYVQGGYVTGEFATPFFDGQARITRQLAVGEDFRLTAGGAAWGGWQDDAERLDVGPSAGISFRVGEARGRLSADYRFRVAGDAEPASGPALTLTAGF